MSTTTTAATVSKSAPHKPILAERFKSKMCKNFETTGICPYEARCMFAHGEHELRTKQMNLTDNLVTEEAIKAFQKARSTPKEAGETSPTAMQTPDVECNTMSIRSTPSGSANGCAKDDANSCGLLHQSKPHLTGTQQETAPVMPPARVLPTPLQVRDLVVSVAGSTDSDVLVNYDAAKYVSPLAAAMLCRRVISDACHCDACRNGQAHHSSTVLLA